jgi:hypothetical protein
MHVFEGPSLQHYVCLIKQWYGVPFYCCFECGPQTVSSVKSPFSNQSCERHWQQRPLQVFYLTPYTSFNQQLVEAVIYLPTVSVFPTPGGPCNTIVRPCHSKSMGRTTTIDRARPTRPLPEMTSPTRLLSYTSRSSTRQRSSCFLSSLTEVEFI